MGSIVHAQGGYGLHHVHPHLKTELAPFGACSPYKLFSMTLSFFRTSRDAGPDKKMRNAFPMRSALISSTSCWGQAMRGNPFSHLQNRAWRNSARTPTGEANVINHCTQQGQDEAAKRRIKGASAELGNPHGFLSVHSMNQLIHHQSFTVDGLHIATVFHNIFPFLQVLNE